MEAGEVFILELWGKWEGGAGSREERASQQLTRSWPTAHLPTSGTVPSCHSLTHTLEGQLLGPGLGQGRLLGLVDHFLRLPWGLQDGKGPLGQSMGVALVESAKVCFYFPEKVLVTPCLGNCQ